MNFDTSKSSYNMPELSYAYGYPILLGVMGCVVAGMFYYFYRKRWF
jgi:magnesium transporter